MHRDNRAYFPIHPPAAKGVFCRETIAFGDVHRKICEVRLGGGGLGRCSDEEHPAGRGRIETFAAIGSDRYHTN